MCAQSNFRYCGGKLREDSSVLPVAQIFACGFEYALRGEAGTILPMVRKPFDISGMAPARVSANLSRLSYDSRPAFNHGRLSASRSCLRKSSQNARRFFFTADAARVMFPA